MIIANPTIEGIHTVAAIERVIARSARKKVIAVAAIAAVVATARLHGPQHQIGMAEAGAVGEAHCLDDVVAVGHHLRDRNAIVGIVELQDQRIAVSTLANDEIRCHDPGSELDDIVSRVPITPV